MFDDKKILGIIDAVGDWRTFSMSRRFLRMARNSTGRFGEASDFNPTPAWFADLAF
jgi:hypothetical protein